MNATTEEDIDLVSSSPVSIDMSFLYMLFLDAMLLVAVTNFVECCGKGMEDAVDN